MSSTNRVELVDGLVRLVPRDVTDEEFAERVARVGYDDDRYWAELCDQSPEALKLYDLPDARIVLGVTECPLCLRDTHGESACPRCLSSIDPETVR